MSKLIDLTGRRFGRLLVVSCYGKNSKRKYFWNCICDCGNKKVIAGSSLKKGVSKSCGCLKNENTIMRNFIDLSNKTYGKLKAIKVVGKTKYGNYIWKCICSCGKSVDVPSSYLRNGDVKSCGCLNKGFVANELKNYFIKFHKGISEYRIFRNPKTNYFLPYDIYLPKENIYIEIQGIQHYIKGNSGIFKKTQEEFEYQKKKDRMKRKFARKNGIYIEIDLRKIKTTEEAIIYIESFM